MTIRLRIYPQYSSWGYGLGLGSSWGVDRSYRRRMRAQQRQIARDQQLFSLHLMRQQLALHRQMAQWNASSAMHASSWGVPALTGLTYLPGSYLTSPHTYGYAYGAPYGVSQAAWGGYRFW